MATGSVSITITIPTTGSISPDTVGRNIAAQMLDQARQAIGGGVAVSGNLLYPPGGPAAQVIGTFTYVAPTS